MQADSFDLCTNCREIPMQAQLALPWGIVTLRATKKKSSCCCPHKKLQAGLLDSRIILRGRRCIGLVWRIPTNHLISIAAKKVLETHHHHPQAAAAAATISTSKISCQEHLAWRYFISSFEQSFESNTTVNHGNPVWVLTKEVGSGKWQPKG